MTPDRLKVLVTAGASGIGYEIARAFHDSGATVILCDIDADATRRAEEDLPGSTGIVADVSSADAVRSMFTSIADEFEGLDVLVNNAGIGGPRCPVDELDEADWDRTIAVNLSGAFYCTKYASRLMKAARSGAIINISSASARTGLPLRAPYVSSKVGLQGLTHNLARELGPFNIRVNAILPGAVDNERGKALVANLAKREGISVEDAERRRLRYISMRSRIAPGEVGQLAVFLASEKGRHISGQMIGVCGNSEWEE